MSIFIQVGPDPSKNTARMVVNDRSDKKRVKSQAMKAFLDEQRNACQQNGKAVLSSEDAWRQHRRKAQRAAKTSSLPREFVSHADDMEPVDHDDSSDLATTCILHIAESTHAYRVVLVQNFCDGYFPASAQTNGSLDGILKHWTSPSCAAMETGNDALALLHFGGAINDKRVSHEGHRKYLQTLHRVRQDIQRGPSHSNFEGLFAAAQDLLNCEIYQSVSSGFSSWGKHIMGMKAIIESHGFRKVSPEFNAFLFAQFRHVSLMYALVLRSKGPLLEDYLTMSPDSAEPGSIEQLTRLALILPPLLEKIDAFSALNEGDGLQEDSLAMLQKMSIIQKLDELGEGLVSWRHNFSRDLRQSEIPDTEQQCRHFEHLALAFQTILRLLVCEAQSMVHRTNGSLVTSARAAADACAKELMESVPSLAASTGGDVGKAMAVRAPFHFVSTWYRRSSNERGLARCSNVESRYRDACSYLDWDALLPFGFLTILWIS
ncbi:hypothetical protein PRZ48_015049 [Zasmidium cellare]|uniref:Uncharacterized protein n=1 Tax=Zasmidium cellare TaxID=395010 RepID=A0ABR0DXI2_ZASCE|nr:hypothetical protein PRZ48_015049 [Zasmidium cellare]